MLLCPFAAEGQFVYRSKWISKAKITKVANYITSKEKKKEKKYGHK